MHYKDSLGPVRRQSCIHQSSNHLIMVSPIIFYSHIFLTAANIILSRHCFICL